MIARSLLSLGRVGLPRDILIPRLQALQAERSVKYDFCWAWSLAANGKE